MFSLYLTVVCLMILSMQKIIFPKDSILLAPIFFVVFSQLSFFIDPPRFFPEDTFNVLIIHTITLIILFLTLVVLGKKYLCKNFESEKLFNFNENIFLYNSTIFLMIPYLIFSLNGADLFSILTRFYKTSIFEDSNYDSL